MSDAGTMDALLFRHGQLRYLGSRAVYGAARRFWSARLPPLALVRLPLPEPPRPGWRRLDVRLAGICGSDLGMLTGAESLYFEPEASYPFVPGHELTGALATARAGFESRFEPDRELEPGSRVAVWPVLGCAARGTDPLCPACRAGWVGMCAQRDSGWPGPGLAIGYNRETGGGWAASCLVHESQLRPLPDAVSDAAAVLLDPAASALAAVLRTASPGVERTLVVGGGTIGLLAACLHRVLEQPGTVESIVRHDFQRAWLARRNLPGTVVRDDRTFRDWAAERGMASRRVWGYGHVFRGAFDRVIVAAGTRSALRWGLQAVRPRGTLALLTSPPASRLDLTPLWYREVTVRGVYAYGPVPWEGEERHPYDVLLPALATGRLVLRDVVTHSFPLSQYVEALRLAVRDRQGGGGVIKVAFRPGAAT